MKAILVYHEISFPKTHDLLLLLTLIEAVEPQLVLYRDLVETLNPYSVLFRYPGEQLDTDEAAMAIKAIKKLRKLFQ